MQIFELRVDLGTEGMLTREIASDDADEAVRKMEIKFPDCKGISVISSRRETVEEKIEIENTRLATSLGQSLDEVDYSEETFLKRKRRGILIVIAGIASTVYLFYLGWIFYYTIFVVFYGVYEIFRGASGVKIARERNSWE